MAYKNWKECAWKNLNEGKDHGLIKVNGYSTIAMILSSLSLKHPQSSWSYLTGLVKSTNLSEWNSCFITLIAFRFLFHCFLVAVFKGLCVHQKLLGYSPPRLLDWCPQNLQVYVLLQTLVFHFQRCWMFSSPTNWRYCVHVARQWSRSAPRPKYRGAL